jgi:hypothetical protein
MFQASAGTQHAKRAGAPIWSIVPPIWSSKSRSASPRDYQTGRAAEFFYAIKRVRLVHLLGRRGSARVSLVDRSWIHVWKPMLHTFAAGTWNIYQQQVQFVAHARMHHFKYIPEQLDAIDRTARRIHLAPLQADGEVVAGRRELVYDVLVLACDWRSRLLEMMLVKERDPGGGGGPGLGVGQVRSGLTAGGRRIRTRGPALPGNR